MWLAALVAIGRTLDIFVHVQSLSGHDVSPSSDKEWKNLLGRIIHNATTSLGSRMNPAAHVGKLQINLQTRLVRLDSPRPPRLSNLLSPTREPTTASTSPSRPTPAMSVLVETSVGDIVIDLLVDHAPKLCEK